MALTPPLEEELEKTHGKLEASIGECELEAAVSF